MSDADLSDENFSLLTEAVDNDLICDSMYKTDSKEPQTIQPIEQLKSLRYSSNDDAEQLKITTKFQNKVAKHLENMLEESLSKQLKKHLTNPNDMLKAKRKKSNIRLLSDSKHYISLSNDTELVNNINKRNAKFRIAKRYNSDEDLDRFKAVAVDSKIILSQVEVSRWAKRKNKRIFEYRKLKNGKLQLIEECK